MNIHESDKASVPNENRFQTTQWSMILHAADPDSSESQAALATLCEAYWFPLYAYARRRTDNEHMAQDLTQGFFVYLLEKQSFSKPSLERGRFRSFLLTAFKNFMANEWNKANSKKRGGDQTLISLDFDDGETRFQIQPAISMNPDKAFDRQWVLTALDRVLNQLRQELSDRGQSNAFEELKSTLTEQGSDSLYVSVAQKLDITPNAAKQTAYRLRLRYQQLFRSEISRTVEDQSEIDPEIHRLLDALSE
ncbi:MAG: RNA polymerase sigma factor [Rubripirellula sp.]|jgi:RNA polymerase sigma-70 factor (ECF subfamily)